MAKRQKKPEKNPAFNGGRSRTWKADLQASTNTFVHRDGRTITLVATFNLGEARYFQELYELISKLEADGATVITTKLAGRIEDGRDEREQKLIATILNSVSGRRHMLRVLGLPWVIRDDSAMCLHPGWFNADVPLVDFARMVGDNIITKRWRFTQQPWLLKLLPCTVARALQVANLVGAGREFQRKNSPYPEWYQRIQTWREHVLGTAMLGAVGDVVASCDPTMMRGLGLLLLRSGFTLESSTWRTVGSARPRR